METGDFRHTGQNPKETSDCSSTLTLHVTLLWLLGCLIWFALAQPAFAFPLGAITCQDYINFNGNNVTVDSFDSSDPAHSYWLVNLGYGVYTNTGTVANPYRKANGNVATDSTITGVISIGNADIFGHVNMGPGGSAELASQGSVGDLNWVPFTTGIQQGYAASNMNVIFPDVTLPATNWISLANNSAITNSGYFTMGQINNNMTFSGGTNLINVTLYLTNGISLSGSKTVTIGTNATVTIYAGNSISDGGNGAIRNVSQHASQMIIYGLPSLTSISLHGNVPTWGLIYAPNAIMLVKGGGSFGYYGAFICYSVTCIGNTTFSYDEALASILPAAPIITAQPTNQTTLLVSNATFTVSATGTPPIWYQWYFTQTNQIPNQTFTLAGGTNYSSLTITNVQTTNAGTYWVMASAPFGSVKSSNAILTVISPPTILLQPTNQIVLADSPAFFSTFATGTQPFVYQWQFNGTNLPNSIITTVAGNGTNVYYGDGGAATNAGLATLGVAVDAHGNEFIADSYNNRIRKVDANGIISTVVGNGTQGFSGDGGAATNAMLYFPAGIAMDAVGNLFIADTSNSRIRKVDTNGIITTVAGNGTLGYSGDGGAATNASLRYPRRVALDINGNLFIADAYNSLVRKVDVNGIITTVAGNGTPGYSGDGGDATNAMFNDPEGMAMDVSGKLFIADFLNYRIRKVDTNGVITTVAGNGTQGISGDGGKATNATLVGPIGVTIDAGGNLFIADFYGNRIRKVDINCIITTVAGKGDMNSWYPNGSFSGDGGIATNAMMNGPNNVVVDAGGHLFISDSGNKRIRKVTSSSSQPSYLIGPISTNNAGLYSVTVTNAAGMAISSNAALSVVFSPSNLMRVAGSIATFAVATFGSEPLNFQWQKNGTNVFDAGNFSGTTSNQLTIVNVSVADVGNYRAIVSDMTTSVTTSNATLTVYATAAATLGGYSFTSANGFQFQIAGVPGFNYAVQTSTNLTDWLSLITNASPFSFTDTSISVDHFPQRFYRAVYLP